MIYDIVTVIIVLCGITFGGYGLYKLMRAFGIGLSSIGEDINKEADRLEKKK